MHPTEIKCLFIYLFMIAVQRSYQLSYQASLELLVFVWIQTYSQERQTKIMCMYSFSYWEFMLQI